MTAEFVAVRGGGLLVLGGRSFERAGLAGTPLEEVLPVDVTDRRATVARTASGSAPAANAVALTTDGAAHPATRLAVTAEESRKRWSQLPAMAAVSAAGTPRPGAQVLAVTTSGSELRPLLITQRYGVGRSMVFAGEATWRWRMLLPSTNTTHELVWRQMARWVGSGSAERIEIPPTSVVLPGTTDPVSVLVRDESFKPVANAEVTMRVRDPNGQERSLPAALADPERGAIRRPSGSIRRASIQWPPTCVADPSRRRPCRARCWSVGQTSSSASRGSTTMCCGGLPNQVARTHVAAEDAANVPEL